MLIRSIIIVLVILLLRVISFIVLSIQSTINENIEVSDCFWFLFNTIYILFESFHSFYAIAFILHNYHYLFRWFNQTLSGTVRLVHVFSHLIKFMYYLNHSIFLMHSPSYFITIIHWFFFQPNIFRNIEVSEFLFLTEFNFYDSTYSIVLIHSPSYLINHIHCFVN